MSAIFLFLRVALAMYSIALNVGVLEKINPRRLG